MMNPMIPWVWAAGGVHLAIAAANLALPRRLHYRENLAKVSPMIRQMFVVHSIYIVLVLLLFGVLCLLFAPELAGASPMGRFLAAAMSIFWLLRIPVQVFYYDADLRRQNRTLDLLFILTIAVLAAIFAVAALGLVH